MGPGQPTQALRLCYNRGMTTIGRVERVRRYPVKSMRGEDLPKAFVSFAGLQGDRVYAFVDPASKEADFPWVTAREVPEMLLFEPRFVAGPQEGVFYPDPPAFRVRVKTPEGEEQGIEEPRFVAELERRWGRPLKLRFSEKGMHDAQPISLVGLASIESLGRELGEAPDPLRFRANFYLSWASGRAFEEDELVGRVLEIGETLRLMVTKRDSRCAIVNLEPGSARSSPETLKAVGRLRQGLFGVYAAVLREGSVRAGDPVRLA